MVILKPSLSLQSKGFGLSQEEDTIVQFGVSQYGLDSSYFTVVNSGRTDLHIAFGGYDHDGDIDDIVFSTSLSLYF